MGTFSGLANILYASLRKLFNKSKYERGASLLPAWRSGLRLERINKNAVRCNSHKQAVV